MIERFTLKVLTLIATGFIFISFQLQAAPEKGLIQECRIVVSGLRSAKGTVNILLFLGNDGFPENQEKAFLQRTIMADRDSVIFLFKNIPEGEYAFAILHDENENKEMDKNFLGIPKEGFAFSNDYKPNSPKIPYEKAKIFISDKNARIVVKMNYYL